MSRILEVPLLEPDSFLTLDVGTDLPEDPTEICQLLANERSAPKWWIAIAAAYAQNGVTAPAIEVIETGLERAPGVDEPENRSQLLGALSWLRLRELRASPTADKRAAYDKALTAEHDALNAFQQASTGSSAGQNVPAVLAQGALPLAVGNIDDALAPFQTVLGAQPQNVYAKIGRARVLYARRNFRGALRIYQDVLKQAPGRDFTPDPRIGIGLCFWQLHDKLKARKAWERSLSLHSISVTTNGNGGDSTDSDGKASPSQSAADKGIVATAHALLGVWFLDAAYHGVRAEFESNYVGAIDHFQKAYTGGQISLPALKIASYLFSKHDMVRVDKLTDRVLGIATLPSLLGEALFWKARAAHYAGDLDSALALYTQAATADPLNVAAAIGKGIVELSQDRASEAMLTFELAVQAHPHNADALFYAGMFGSIHGSSPAKSREQLELYLTQKRAAREAPRVEALVALARLTESDPVSAHSYLRAAAEELAKHPESPAFKALTVPIAINLGVLAYSRRDFEEALTQFETEADEQYAYVLQYNRARTLEALGRVEEARAVYAKLKTAEAKSRLILLEDAESGGVPGEAARSKLAILSELPSAGAEVRALYSWYLRSIAQRGVNEDARRRATAAEQELHKQTLSTIDKHDSYALVSLGNTYLINAQSLPRNGDAAAIAKKQRAFVRAAEFFEKALQIDPYNAYAAQGVAIALADTKRPALAMPVFSRIRETLSDDLTAFVNSGHCLMELGDYGRASEVYAQAQARAPSDPQLLTLLGRSWYARGSRARDPDALATALDWAERALEAAKDQGPTDAVPADVATPKGAIQPDLAAPTFNVAYIRLALAEAVKRRAPESRTVLQVEAARDGLVDALSVLRNLADGVNSGLPFSGEDLEDRVEQAEATLVPQLERAVEEQRAYEGSAAAKREEARRLREAELRAREEERLKREAEAAEREAKLAAERERLSEQAKQWEAEREAAREAEASQPDDGKRSKSRRTKKDDDLIDDRSEDELAPLELSDGESDADKGEGSDDENADDADAPKRRKAVLDDDDSDDDASNNNGVDADDKSQAEADKNEPADAAKEGGEEGLDDLF